MLPTSASMQRLKNFALELNMLSISVACWCKSSIACPFKNRERNCDKQNIPIRRMFSQSQKDNPAGCPDVFWMFSSLGFYLVLQVSLNRLTLDGFLSCVKKRKVLDVYISSLGMPRKCDYILNSISFLLIPFIFLIP